MIHVLRLVGEYFSARGLLALLNRSLQTDDRLIRTHIIRFLFIVVSYGMLVLVQGRGMWMGAPGQWLFSSMCMLNFAAITVAALSYFSSAITEEKEDMTLGLLKMADVNSFALLIGKSAPRLITALILLTAQLPFTMLAVTLGGVSLGQVMAAYACLFAYLVLCAFMGLCYSVISLRSRTAGFLTGLTLFGYFFGAPLLMYAVIPGLQFYGQPLYDRLAAGFSLVGRICGYPDKAASIAADLATSKVLGVSNASLEWIISTSAFTRLQVVLQRTGFSDGAITSQVIWNLTFAGVFFLLAWLLFEKCTQNEKPAAESRGILHKPIGFRGQVFGAGRAWNLALIWKDFNFVGGGRSSLFVKLLLYGGLVGLLVWSNRNWNAQLRLEDFGNFAMGIGLFALVVEAGIQASRVFYTETKWKTLSSIMLLPKSIGAIAYSKVFGAALSLAPAMALFIFGVCCAPTSFADSFEATVTQTYSWYFISQIILFIHIAAILSLYLKWGALPATFAVVYGGNMLVMFVLMLVSVRSGPSDGFFGLISLGSFGLCVVIQFWIGHRLEQMAAA